MSNGFVANLSGGTSESITALQMLSIVHIVITIVIAFLVYYIISRALDRIGYRYATFRRAVGIIRFSTATIIAILALYVIYNIVGGVGVQQTIVATIIVVSVILVIALMFRNLLENLGSYAVIVLSGIVRDGDRVKIITDEGVYEGRLELNNYNFAKIVDEKGTLSYIPYKSLLNSIIIKSSSRTVNIKLRFYGYNIQLKNIINEISSIVDELGLAVESANIKLVSIKENEATVIIEVGVKKDVNYFIVEFIDRIRSKSLYRFDVELL
ncbi:MAG: hypothetical protein JHC33_05200 [Ignisphaera sp.]|nr:hypothetical protein [Ignisphaera sp.]